jgi:hypothetical protein
MISNIFKVSAKSSKTSMFLIVLLLVFLTISTVFAQSKTIIKLEGTTWEGAPISYSVGSAMGTLQCFFSFEKQDKAVRSCVAMQSNGTMPGYNVNDPLYNPVTNDPYQPKLVITPGGAASSDIVGKFKQTNNSIQIEFFGAVMKVKIKDNIVLYGETIYTDKSIPNENWVMRRVSDITKPSVSPSIKSGTSITEADMKDRFDESDLIDGEISKLLEYRGMADIKVESGEYGEALKMYDRILQVYAKRAEIEATRRGVSPDLLVTVLFLDIPNVYNRRGLAKVKTGDKTGACSDFKSAASFENYGKYCMK